MISFLMTDARELMGELSKQRMGKYAARAGLDFARRLVTPHKTQRGLEKDILKQYHRAKYATMALNKIGRRGLE
jgi:hypothetical protein